MSADVSTVLPLVTGLIVISVTAAFWLGRKFLFSMAPPITLINKDTKYSLKLIEKRSLNHDTRVFKFELPSPNHVLGLPVGQHVFLTAKVDDKLVIRPYTPISCEDDKGYMELLVKVYFKGVHPKFPEGGKMTQYLENMKIGESIDVRGPNGLLVYKGLGLFKIQAEKKLPAKDHKYKKLCMIAGGSGITPMYQMIHCILKNPNDKTQLWLLYANQTESDILLRNELDELAANHPDSFKCWYTLDRPQPDWKYSTGFVNDEMISSHMCPPASDVLVTMCGPPPMIQFACTPALDKLNYKNRFAF
ncbi:hypothetical protein HELRODRAFT_185829 [Helobdella robusta]|uniref:NADH-cytochrome b5 reductase n=1 Tax=Helobdella robusta TaxID=6412 RepID=T1FNC4_HELRO|nr:hypothetical protein HELRODRAFT_185829 [Helobdella robusta]ESN98463.1 hypothetical protein HELRODRAFT_185829 [Helobdella robusta]